MKYDDNPYPTGAIPPLKAMPFSTAILRRLAFVPAMIAMIFLVSCSSDTMEPENSASPLRVRLITGQQYSNAITQIFGADIGESVFARRLNQVSLPVGFQYF